MEKASVQAKDLQTTLRRILPFLGEDHEQYSHVWIEVDGGELRATGSNGYHLVHSWFEADWPNGEWLLDGGMCTKLEAACDTLPPVDIAVEISDTAIKFNWVGNQEYEVLVPVRSRTWIDYSTIKDSVSGNISGRAIIARSELMKFIRPRGGLVGLELRDGKCFGVRTENMLDTTRAPEVQIPTQLVFGEGKAAFDRQRLKPTVESFAGGITVNFQASDKQPVVFEGDRHWHILMPWSEYPQISALGVNERKTLDLAADIIDSIRKEEVKAIVDIDEGQMTITWDPEPLRTVVRNSQGTSTVEVEDGAKENEVPGGPSSDDAGMEGHASGGGGGPAPGGSELPSPTPIG